MRQFILMLIVMFSVVAGFANLAAMAQQPQRRALLIGVAKYDKAGFTNLDYPEADVKSLEEVLSAAGFKVTLMLGSLAETDPLRATHANIAHQLLTPEEYRRANERNQAKSQPGFVARLGSLNKDDVVLVAIAGHGRQKSEVIDNRKQEIPYYCPADAINAEESSWISINLLMQNISKFSSSQNNLILVDACRDNPSRGRGIDGAQVTLPGDNLAICFSSSAGTEAYEAKELGHGIFTHFVIQGLRGEAANRQNQVTWDTLVSFVRTSVAEQAPKLVQREQLPNAMGNVKGRSPVLVSMLTKLRPSILKSPFSESEATEAVSSWAEFSNSGVRRQTKTAGIELVLIPPGEFVMGNEESVDAIMEAFSNIGGLKREYFTNAEDSHRVTIPSPLWMGRTEVTVGQFRQFVKATEYQTEAEKDGEGGWGYDKEKKDFVGRRPEYTWRNVGWDQTDSHPVVNVSWNDAVAFCNWLSKSEGLPAYYRIKDGETVIVGGRGFRLPSEAEWEYACRAGTTTRYHFGDDPEGLVRVGNVWDSSTAEPFPKYGSRLTGSDGYPFSSPVSRFRSNGFGLYDMHGNVFEWCEDWYGEDYYRNSPSLDPRGPASGSSRVLRGGSWNYLASYCRSANRNFYDPSYRIYYFGFRVLCVVE